ncbi:hypothetical protein BH09BAC2_BH09BAC2_03300 [soil metagenome]
MFAYNFFLLIAAYHHTFDLQLWYIAPIVFMAVVSIFDYILLPVYILLFYIIMVFKRKKYDKETALYFTRCFWLHVFGCIAYTFVFWFIYGGGDSFGYYVGSDIIRNVLKDDPFFATYLFKSNKDIYNAVISSGYGSKVPGSMLSNAKMMLLTSFVSFPSFNFFYIISLFLSFFAFVGNWKLFYILDILNKRRYRNLTAIAVIYMPSIWFWGSGLLKESFCMGALGMIVYLLYRVLINKKISLLKITFLAFYIYLLTIIKSYITFAFFASAGFVIFFWLMFRAKSFLIRIASFLILVPLLIYGMSVISDTIQTMVADSLLQIEVLKNGYERVGQEEVGSSSFKIDFELTPLGMIKKAPVVIFTCLFRPFLWESRKVIMLFSSLEALATLLATLYLFRMTKFFGFFKFVFNDRVALFCFIYSMTFAAFVGFSTFNFGTLVRYKIMFLPFYYYMLVSIYTRYKLKVAQEKISIEETTVTMSA